MDREWKSVESCAGSGLRDDLKCPSSRPLNSASVASECQTCEAGCGVESHRATAAQFHWQVPGQLHRHFKLFGKQHNVETNLGCVASSLSRLAPHIELQRLKEDKSESFSHSEAAAGGVDQTDK